MSPSRVSGISVECPGSQKVFPCLYDCNSRRGHPFINLHFGPSDLLFFVVHIYSNEHVRPFCHAWMGPETTKLIGIFFIFTHL